MRKVLSLLVVLFATFAVAATAGSNATTACRAVSCSRIVMAVRRPASAKR